jgi:hypothetical protein
MNADVADFEVQSINYATDTTDGSGSCYAGGGLAGDAVLLRRGKAIPGDLAGGETRAYVVELKAGQYLRAVVTQPVGVVAIALYMPDGKKVLEQDNQNLSKPSRVIWVTDTAGKYRIDVSVPAHGKGN